MSVTVYSTQFCPWCHKAKEFLKSHKVKFTSLDVGNDSKAAKKMIELSGQSGVPVIDVNGTIIIGFEEAKLREVLKINDKK
jgi:glutaredoxin-like YruB-family protein